MKITFHKYHGTGNDFILIDDRQEQFPLHSEKLIARLCDRRFGIGGDGLMLLRNKEGVDFEMIYFNADGKEGSMCGNGGRCIVAFAKRLGMTGNSVRFIAIDGEHQANIVNDKVSLRMQDVKGYEMFGNDYYLDTGSPHYVVFTEDLNRVNVVKEGREIRYSVHFKEKGTNVNFVQVVSDQEIMVETYERGVEDETYSCGTGVVAAALCHHVATGEKERQHFCNIETKGGKLSVRYQPSGDKYRDIWLEGPTKYVYKGEINVRQELHH